MILSENEVAWRPSSAKPGVLVKVIVRVTRPENGDATIPRSVGFGLRATKGGLLGLGWRRRSNGGNSRQGRMAADAEWIRGGQQTARSHPTC